MVNDAVPPRKVRVVYVVRWKPGSEANVGIVGGALGDPSGSGA